MFKRIALALLVAPLLAAASAQSTPSLAELAPAETIVALSYDDTGIPFDTLESDLAALDWEGAADTVVRYVSALAGDDADMLRGLDDFGGAMDELQAGMDELERVCPGITSTMTVAPQRLLDEALLSVAVSPFNPLPVVTALARVTDEAGAAALQETLVGCFGADEPFTEGDVPLYLLGDGGELPLIVGSVDGVFFASSNPDTARAVVRRARGSDEPALADARMWQERSRFEGSGLGLAVNLAAIADLIEAFVPRDMVDPEAQVLIDRGSAALRTLGGLATEVSAPAEGLRFEAVLAVDRTGGDPQLAELLLCGTCSVSRPFLAPIDAVAVVSESFPIRDLVRYLDSILADASAAAGERLTVRDLLAEAVGVDLDTLLLDWVGEQVHTVVLEPFGTDLGSLFFGMEQAVIVPVSSPEAAELGLQAFGELLAPFQDQIGPLLGGGTGFSSGLMAGILAADGGFGGMPELGGVAVRQQSYGGVDYRRIQIGFGFDVAVALVGNNLVIATPSAALRPIVDTFAGGENILGNGAYLAAVEAAPDGATEISWASPGRSAQGLAELATLLSQPAAAAAQLAATANQSDTFSDFGGFEEFGGPAGELFPLYDIDLSSISPTPLEAGAQIDAQLIEGGVNAFGEIAGYYALGPIPDGAEVSVVMTSDGFDTYLRLIDPNEGVVLLENDDAPDTSRSELAFIADGQRSYWVEAGSYFGDATGPFALGATVTGGSDSTPETAADAVVEPEPESVELPGFAELLALAELPGETLALLADHLGEATGSASVDGDTVVVRSLLRIRW